MRSKALFARKPTLRRALDVTGVSLAIAGAAGIAVLAGAPLLVPPLASSATQMLTRPNSPTSRVRHVILAHLIVTSATIALQPLTGDAWWAMGLATGLALGSMYATRSLHPPAASIPVMILLGHTEWLEALLPAIFGPTFLAVFSLFWRRVTATTMERFAGSSKLRDMGDGR